MRAAVLTAALVFTGLLAFLTFYVLFRTGLDVLVIISLLVLGLLGFGVLGALTRPPDR